jgi:hypothetical protein
MLPARLHRDKQRNSDIPAELQPWLSPTRDSVGQEDRVIQIAEPNRAFSPSSVLYAFLSHLKSAPFEVEKLAETSSQLSARPIRDRQERNYPNQRNLAELESVAGSHDPECPTFDSSGFSFPSVLEHCQMQ